MIRPRSIAFVIAGAGLVFAGVAAVSARSGIADDEPSVDRKVNPKIAAKIDEHDANGDGVIVVEEWPETAAQFEQADRNGDGQLTHWEIYHHFTWTKLVEKASRKDDDLAKKFGQADANGDGAVVMSEFPAADMLFAQIDRDGDEKIVLEELIAYGVEEELAKAFTEKDADLSGTLTREELDDEGREIFELIDVDENDEVSGEEAYAFLYDVKMAAIAMRNGEMTRPKVYGEKPKAGTVTKPTTPTAASGKLGQTLAVLMGRDADGDGALTAREFPGTRALHDLIDIDRDGKIDEAEITVRHRFAEALGVRGAAIKKMAEELGADAGLEIAFLGKEIKGLFDAGRLEEAKAALDEIEVALIRLRAGRTTDK